MWKVTLNPLNKCSTNLTYSERSGQSLVLKLLGANIIYPIADNKWVSPTQVIFKKHGVIVIQNKDKEMLQTRTATSWYMCIDCGKLNHVT